MPFWVNNESNLWYRTKAFPLFKINLENELILSEKINFQTHIREFTFVSVI